MKSTALIILLALATTIMTSCADNKTINGVTYRPYGFFNEETCKNDSVNYEVSGQAVFSGIFFSELFFIPTIYTFGYNLFEPVSAKSELPKNKGVIK